MLFSAVLVSVSIAFGSDSSATATAWPKCSAAAAGSVMGLMEAAQSGDVRAKVWVHVCGSTSVVPGRNYGYTVVITNISNTAYARLNVSVSHYEPLTRASLPYRREAAANGDPRMEGAVWALKDFKPGRSFRVSFTVPFKRHPDPVGSNFDAQIVGRSFVAGAFPHCPCPSRSLAGQTYDVVFLRPAA